VAYVISATSFNQRVIHSTLAGIETAISSLPEDAPGLLIVGEVVNFGHELSWFHKSMPLGGHRVLVARARPGTSRIAEELKGLGADVISVPDVKAGALRAEEALVFHDSLRMLEEFDALLLPSVMAVKALAAGMVAAGSDLRHLPRIPILAVGKGVSEALKSCGLRSETAISGSCLKELQTLKSWIQGKNLAVFTSQKGRPNLERDLKKLGAKVSLIRAYRYEYRYPRVVAPVPSLVIAPSSSALKILADGDLGFSLKDREVCVMGDDTLEAARALGFDRVYRAANDTINEMVKLVFSRLIYS
jgi:uroporphyrinogen III methyltransferase/synthase